MSQSTTPSGIVAAIFCIIILGLTSWFVFSGFDSPHPGPTVGRLDGNTAPTPESIDGTETPEEERDEPDTAPDSTPTTVEHSCGVRGTVRGDASVTETEIAVVAYRRGVDRYTELEPLGQCAVDGNGGFELELAPGHYHLTIGRCDYHVPPKLIRVRAGEWTTCQLELVVAAMVTGVVTDDRGLPLEEAEVLTAGHIYSFDEKRKARKVLTQSSHIGGFSAGLEITLQSVPVYTDEQGRFSLRGLGQTPISLLVHHPTHQSSPIYTRVQAGDHLEIQLVPGRALEGRVVDDTGTAIPGAKVWTNASPAAFGNPGLWHHTRSDDEGRFRLPPKGRFATRINATHPQYQSVSRSLGEDVRLELVMTIGRTVPGAVVNTRGEPLVGVRIVFGSADGGTRVPPVRSDTKGEFLLTGGQPGSEYVSWIHLPGYIAEEHRFVWPDHDSTGERLVLTLDSGAEVRGEVSWDDGTPIESASLRFTYEGEDWEEHINPDTAVVTEEDGSGRFSASGLVPGPYSVRVTSDFLANTERLQIELAAGENPSIELVYPAQIHSVAGVVVNDIGEPIRKAKVALKLPGLDWGRNVETDLEGAFAFEHVPDARIATLEAHCSGYQRHTATEVLLGTTNARIVLERLASITGRVRDSRDRSVREFTLHVATATDRRPSLSKEFSTSDGQFTLTAVPVGNVHLFLQVDGAVVARQELRISPGTTRNVQLRSDAVGTVTVTALYPKGDPVVHGYVFKNHSIRGDWGRTDENGQAQLILPPGKHELSVLPRGFRQETPVVVEIDEGEELVLDPTTINPGLELTLQIRQRSIPLAKQELDLLSLAPPQTILRVRTDDLGYIRRQGLLPGQYRIRTSEFQTRDFELTIEDPGPGALDLVVPREE